MVEPLAQGPGALFHHAAKADVLVAFAKIALEPVIMVPEVMNRQHHKPLRLQPAFQFLQIGVAVGCGIGATDDIEIGGDLGEILVANDEPGIILGVDLDALGVRGIGAAIEKDLGPPFANGGDLVRASFRQ